MLVLFSFVQRGRYFVSVSLKFTLNSSVRCAADQTSLKVCRDVEKIDDDYSFFIRLKIEY